jgi:hypothetical protein
VFSALRLLALGVRTAAADGLFADVANAIAILVVYLMLCPVDRWRLSGIALSRHSNGQHQKRQQGENKSKMNSTFRSHWTSLLLIKRTHSAALHVSCQPEVSMERMT